MAIFETALEGQCPHTIWNENEFNEFYAILSFGILALALWQRNINQTLFESQVGKYGANSVQQFDDHSSNMETLKSSRWSVTDIAESTEISPLEKKHRISETGLVIFLNQLKLKGKFGLAYLLYLAQRKMANYMDNQFRSTF